MTENFSVLSIGSAVDLVKAIKGTDNFVILSRVAAEPVDGIPSAVLTCESISSGDIYSFQYMVEDNGDGTMNIHFPQGSMLIEGHGDIMYTPVRRLNIVPDTIESLFEEPSS